MTVNIHISNAGRSPVVGGSSDVPSPIDLTGIGWIPAVGADEDGAAHPWEMSPTQAWAEKLCWSVPSDHTGMVLIDYEGPRLTDLIQGTKAQREAAIDNLRQRLNACRRVRPNAKFGYYASPSLKHKWPPLEYIRDAVLCGRRGELTNRCQVVFPLAYLLGPNSHKELHHYEILMRTACAMAEEFGLPVCAVVNPTVWDGPNGPLPYGQTYYDTDSFREVVKTCIQFGATDVVLWHSHRSIEGERMTAELGRALRHEEALEAQAKADADLSAHLDIIRECAKEASNG